MSKDSAASLSSPIFSFTCLRFRELLEQRNKNLDFQPDTNEDFTLLYSHHTKYEAYGNWFATHRDGDRDLEPVESEAREGYCSYEDLKRGIDAFFDVVKPRKENVEARLGSMREVDPKLVYDSIKKAYEGHKPEQDR